MRISSVEIYGYDLTYAGDRYVMSGGQVVQGLPSTVVRIVTDEGADGWGEVCPLGALYLEAHAPGARAALDAFAPAVLGLDPTNIGSVHRAMDAALRGHMYARSPIDVACWDLLGNALGLPVTTLLGGRLQDDFPLYRAVPLGPVREMAAFVEEQRRHGIRHFQVKIGEAPEVDAERVATVAGSTETGDRIIADANGGYLLQDAVRAARLLEPLERVYFEQPCRSLEDCAAVRERTSLPVILDESIVDARSLLRAQRNHALEAFNLKIGKYGGLTGARFMRDLARELGLRVTIEDSWGGDLVTAAVSHLAAATPEEHVFTVSFMNDWTNEHVAGYRPRSIAGRGSAPSAPGLGVEVDIDMLGEPLAIYR
ncbi:MAG: mandelate racemase/muconate lactonizing enzyme family protein [Chloroflexota bacterium]